MKLEDLLMQPGEEKQIKQLQQDVKRLEEELDGELQVKRVLQCAMQGPVGCCESCSCLSPFLPFKIQVLLADLAAVEEEIYWMEKKINELMLDVYQVRKQNNELEFIKLKGSQPRREHRQLKKLPSRRLNQMGNNKLELFSVSQNYELRRDRVPIERRASVGSSIEFHSTTYPITNALVVGIGERIENYRGNEGRMLTNPPYTDNEINDPNKVSEELVKCLIGIFCNLNESKFKNKGSSNLPKHALTCINSKGTFNCKTPLIFPCNHNASHPDPYGILPEPDATIRDIGPYKNFIQITRSSVDASHVSECFPAMSKLRVLMQKLSRINISHFNHKQKLAFWINVYNACVMHAFLQHGLPSTQEKLLALMNEASINVGGIKLNVFTIEQFILRHPAEVQNELTNEREMVPKRTCGLDYPEPNVTFALCRGTWSSPALRFYTPDEVMNELENAKVEYLEASVGITGKKRILVPKLMQWHMKDFADDMESLLEWIYSQLPYTSSLKRLIMDCLNGETQYPSQKLIKIQPYESEFRYLLPQ